MMKHGICLLTLIPMRSEPSEKSEMVSQILFGEYFRIEEIKGSWAKIILNEDGYSGWIDVKTITPLSNAGYDHLRTTDKFYTSEIFKTHLAPFGDIIIPPGSPIPKDSRDNAVFIENYRLHIQHLPKIELVNKPTLTSIAEKWLNAPYLWGGKTPFGFDCSGFVQVVFKTLGILIPRDASQQAEIGESVDFIAVSKPGDLAFFDNEEGNITHVGLLYSNDQIIHCSGYVKIDNIDQQGIYSKVQRKYTHRLRIIKRITNM